jgi:hypothetical protein
MYPEIKFLLIDPHYHAFDDDHVYVYQNNQAVDDTNYRRFLGIVRSGIQENKSEYNNAMRLTNALFYKTGEYADLLFSLDPLRQDYDSAKNAYELFIDESHVDLISDMINGEHMIYVIQDYMTIQLAELLKKSFTAARATEWLLISDMRTDMIYAGVPTDMDFVWNDAIQMAVIKIMRPKVSMIKFHPPYYATRDVPIVLSLARYTGADPKLKTMAADILYCKRNLNLDMIASYRKYLHMYLASSDVYLQAWARSTSGETRLIITREDIDKPYQNYDHTVWDAKFAYLNTLRGYAYFADFYEIVKSHPKNIYCGCFDCMLELLVLSDYLLGPRSNMSIDISAAIKIASEKTDELFELVQIFNDILLYSRDLKCVFHGQLLKVPVNPMLYRIRRDQNKSTLIQYGKNVKPVFEASMNRGNRYNIEYKKTGTLKLAENLEDITDEDTLKSLAKSIVKK